MAQLRQDYQKFVARETEVIAVGPDTADAFQKYWEKEAMPFIGLADPDHTVARQYDQEVNFLKLGRIPAQMVIDKNGILRYVHYSRSMSDIPTNEDILKLIDKLEA
jgi:peroxiredoxin Q/BCP